jgi:hypothetical protein
MMGFAASEWVKAALGAFVIVIWTWAVLVFAIGAMG